MSSKRLDAVGGGWEGVEGVRFFAGATYTQVPPIDVRPVGGGRPLGMLGVRWPLRRAAASMCCHLWREADSHATTHSSLHNPGGGQRTPRQNPLRSACRQRTTRIDRGNDHYANRHSSVRQPTTEPTRDNTEPGHINLKKAHAKQHTTPSGADLACVSLHPPSHQPTNQPDRSTVLV